MLPALKQRAVQDEQESLLELYWNRAGVKRELSSLKRDHYELLDKLEQQENAIIRAQSQLEGLERLLVNPLAAANAMVYFQLRHLWRIAAIKVEQFSRELATQKQKREQAALHKAVLAKRNRRLEAIKLKFADLTKKRQQAVAESQQYTERLERMNLVVRFLAGPSLKHRIEAARKNCEALDERIAELREAVDKIQAEPLPDADGLSLENRRVVNIAVIALAQELVVFFAEHDLARMARKASQRPVGDMKFGDRGDCDRMVDWIRRRVDDLKRNESLPDRVKVRAEGLMGSVEYRHETDATPMPEQLGSIALASGDGGDDCGGALPINVLEGDYWDLTNALC